MTGDTDTEARAWAVLQRVMDPEVPVLSVCDLGLVREVRADGDGVEVVMTPTYSGCPATEAIAADVERALGDAGFAPARVTQRLAPAWTSDWISTEGRRRLAEAGIAPPRPAADAAQAIRFVACPRCGSRHTERLSAFGSTACKSIWRCRACGEPFEQFKAI